MFLIEPYNAYQKPIKPKHWMQMVEEEEFIHRITMMEQQNLALKSQSPQPSSQQVQDGQYAPNAGAGGIAIQIPSVYDPYNGILLFSGSQLIIPNPTGDYDQSYNAWVEVHCHNCPNITSLDVSYNNVDVVDFSGCNNLTTLYVNNNQLTSYPTTPNCPNLVNIDVSGNLISQSFDFSNSNLVYLGISDNYVPSLKVHGSSKLEQIYCYRNLITSIDLTGCTSITHLEFSGCQISSVNLTPCKSTLQDIDFSNNKFTSIDITNCPNMWGIGLSNNMLTTLDLTGITNKCQELLLDGNNLTQASVNYIVTYLTSLGTIPVSGVLTLQGGTNAIPSPALVSALQGKNWTVQTN